MLNYLPTALCIGGKTYRIRTDYRVILNIFSAFEDNELSKQDKCYVCLKCLYIDIESIPKKDMQEAAEKAYWFVGGGDIPKSGVNFKTLDWEKDEHIIFPALSKAAGYEVRNVPYLHWWVLVGCSMRSALTVCFHRCWLFAQACEGQNPEQNGT